MLDFSPEESENDPELCADESLDISWEPGDLDPERLWPGEV